MVTRSARLLQKASSGFQRERVSYREIVDFELVHASKACWTDAIKYGKSMALICNMFRYFNPHDLIVLLSEQNVSPLPSVGLVFGKILSLRAAKILKLAGLAELVIL